MYHYKQSGSLVGKEDFAKAEIVQKHLYNCEELRKSKGWSGLLKETKNAISLGVDSAPKVYALQVEALLKLHRHEEANAIHKKRSRISSELSIELFGLAGNGYLSVIESQVYMAVGR